MDSVNITAGQLYQKNTTFTIEFYKPATEEGQKDTFLARAFISFEIWMSFIIDKGYELKNIYIGERNLDYTISARKDDSQESLFGDLISDDKIMNYFSFFVDNFINNKYTFNIYENLFKGHAILRNLVPTFSNIRIILIDRYFSIELTPNFNTLLGALIDIG